MGRFSWLESLRLAANVEDFRRELEHSSAFAREVCADLVRLALVLGRSVRDCVCLTLARRAGAWLVAADERFGIALDGDGAQWYGNDFGGLYENCKLTWLGHVRLIGWTGSIICSRR